VLLAEDEDEVASTPSMRDIKLLMRGAAFAFVLF